MDCKDAALLLAADVDGELDLVRHLELEAHLKTCAACARRRDELVAMRSAVQRELPRHNAPADVLARLQQKLKTVSAEKPSAPVLAFPRMREWSVGIGMAASLAVALFTGFAWGQTHAREQRNVAELIDDHVRSLAANHLVDVVSTDQHTVKPWFAGKLDFSPPVVDLSEAGFPLGGGRLETIDGHSAAALVYHRRQHIINVFIWPSEGSSGRFTKHETKGYAAVSWQAGGFVFFAVSDIPLQELARFGEQFRSVVR